MLVFAQSAVDRRFLSQCPVSPSLPEREPELRQQSARLVIGARGGDEGYLETPQFVDLVVLDLGNAVLLAQPARVVPTPVKAAGRAAAEAADPGQHYRDQ